MEFPPVTDDIFGSLNPLEKGRRGKTMTATHAVRGRNDMRILDLSQLT
jgi:hypothetical protein